MFLAENEIFSGVLSEYSSISPRYFHSQKWHQMTEEQLWHELCLCILSSNVPYELALSALRHLQEQGYLSIEWIANNPEADRLIAVELSKAIYLPIKTDGSLRKYRFPNARAKNIFKSAIKISLKADWLHSVLVNSPSEQDARLSLINNISGFGLKEASHFLRNIGYSNRLAIIDTHVISFLDEINALAIPEIKTVTPKIYRELEDTLQEICSEWSLMLSVFDMAIWRYMRKRDNH